MTTELLVLRESSEIALEDATRRSRWISLVEQSEGGCVEASFAFRMVGVSPRGMDSRISVRAAHAPIDTFNVLAIAQAAGQARGAIWFEYRSRGVQSVACECLIRGAVSAMTAGEAVDRATSMWQETAQAFGRADGDYVFEPTILSSEFDDSPETRTVALRRAAVRIGSSHRRTSGFQQGVGVPNTEESLSMPMAGDWGAVNHVVRALACSSVPLAMRVALDPVTLTPRQIQNLIRALSWLNAGSPKGLSYGKDHRTTAGADAGLQVELARILTCWIRRPAGFRVTAELRAQGQVPTAVIVALQQDMPGLAVVEDLVPRLAAGDVDLSDLAHGDLSLPGTLPSRNCLLDLGARPILASHRNALSDEGPIVGALPGVRQQVIRIPEAYRDQHCYAVGASGAGKTTFCYNSIVHDLHRGHGVLLIDPAGRAFDDVLRSIPEDRVEDVVIIDPHDKEWVVGLNLLAPEGPDASFQRQLAVNEMLGIFDRLYDLRQTGGPMFEIYMRNAMFLVIDSPESGGTLIEVVRVFEDKKFRDRLISACPDRSVVSFWKRIAEPATGEASLTGMAPYVTCKLNQFVQNAFIRPMVGQTNSSLSFSKVLSEKKIVLVNLAVGHLGPADVQLLGMLVMSKLFRAAFSRPAAENRAPRMHVYLDEFQYHLTESMAGALSQLRKHNVCMTLSHQHLSQLVEARMGTKLLDAVLGNAATKLLFRLGPSDADRVASCLGPDLRAEDLQRLANFEVAACVPSPEGSNSTVIARTLPAVECPYRRADVSAIKALQHRYSRLRTDVEADIATRP